MEALDNAFRIVQQYFLGKALFWFDYAAAVVMFAAVLFQGNLLNFLLFICVVLIIYYNIPII